MDVTHETVGAEERYTTARGVMIVRRPAPHVLLISGHGHADAVLVDHILQWRDAIVAEQGKIALFDDLQRVSGYDSEVRARLTKWAHEHKREIVAFHILVRSKLVAMGVSVASLALGSAIHAHARRETFEAALARETGRFSSRPYAAP